MPKRRTRNSSGRYLDEQDNPIGLTGAFAPVKGPQSVDYDEDDDPVGLTQAFGAIPDQDEPHVWDEAGKWKDFDWDAAFGDVEDANPSGSAPRQQETSRPEPEPQGGGSEQEPAASAEGLSEGAEAHSDGFAEAEGGLDAESYEQPSAPRAKSQGPKHGRHAAPEPEISPRMKKSKRTRRVLIVLVVLLAVVIGALAFYMYRTFSSSQQEAAQQTQEQAGGQREDLVAEKADDAADSTTRLADVPDLSVLLGKTQDEAVAAIGRGALVTSSRETNEEGNPIKMNLNVALTEEAADSKTGTPTVYLGLGEDGKVRQAGYSASASALGFGSLSFSDAVSNEHVIEKTLAKAGVTVQEGSATLPANKDEYSTYSSDGTTVVRESCSFEGDASVGATPCTWSSVLSYDYTTQVVTGNLADTVRIIYVYITMK